ncbi:hypothetical protein ABID23_000309 [Bartonella silvatica]|uniref:Uncharacterized protein n=1 Tax=Bartonella silvatica TaxID=357760 RepID=A0ABV2HFL0_9HYPH
MPNRFPTGLFCQPIAEGRVSCLGVGHPLRHGKEDVFLRCGKAEREWSIFVLLKTFIWVREQL